MDQTVLANEQVSETGVSWRSGAQVIRKELKQWFFRTSSMASELLEGLESLEWPSQVCAMQKAWIGKSSGLEIQFLIQKSKVESKRTFLGELYKGK